MAGEVANKSRVDAEGTRLLTKFLPVVCAETDAAALTRPRVVATLVSLGRPCFDALSGLALPLAIGARRALVVERITGAELARF